MSLERDLVGGKADNWYKIGDYLFYYYYYQSYVPGLQPGTCPTLDISMIKNKVHTLRVFVLLAQLYNDNIYHTPNPHSLTLKFLSREVMNMSKALLSLADDGSLKVRRAVRSFRIACTWEEYMFFFFFN
jgi:hypothetical protein